jgi:small conductance mechanosensitive channel
VDHVYEFVNLSELTTSFVVFLPKLLAAVLFLVAFHLLYRVTSVPLEAALSRSRLHQTLVQLLVRNIYRYTIGVFGLVMALDQLGINVGAALAGIGVAGIAVGFAAQDSLANVISGFLIFWDQPFTVGTWIRVEGQFGRVADITLRTTRIQTKRNTWVIIPNKNIIDAVVENYSKHGETRVDVQLGIAYKENVAEARRVLLEAVRGLPDVLAKPQPDVVVTQLGDSSVNLDIRVWIDDPGDEPPVRNAVLEASKNALDAAGIEIPVPHLQLFFDEIRPPVWKELERLISTRPPSE